MMNLYMISVETSERWEIEIKEDTSIEELKKAIKKSNLSQNKMIKIFRKGAELSSSTTLAEAGIDEYDILFFRESYPELPEKIDLKMVNKAKDWLKENIGIDEEKIILKNYEKSENNEKKVIFEEEKSQFKLSVSDDGINEYDFSCSEGNPC